MKKRVLNVAFTAAIIASIASVGCGSERAASGSGDSTVTDTSARSTPSSTDTTSTTDTARRDTTRTNPPQH